MARREKRKRNRKSAKVFKTLKKRFLKKNTQKTKQKTDSKTEAKSNIIANIDDIRAQNPALEKYWNKRYQYFSRYDEGIQLDAESFYSVTPEKVAEQQATRMACDIIVDGFCGAGGNTIQFAKTCNRVIAIDIDPQKIAMARHNAGIYGVADKIDFFVGDFLEICKSGQLVADVVFLSPPWGGLDYWKFDFDIETSLKPIGASELMRLARRISSNIALFLPKNSKRCQIDGLAKDPDQYEVESNYGENKKCLGLTAYYGKYFNEIYWGTQERSTYLGKSKFL